MQFAVSRQLIAQCRPKSHSAELYTEMKIARFQVHFCVGVGMCECLQAVAICVLASIKLAIALRNKNLLGYQ